MEPKFGSSLTLNDDYSQFTGIVSFVDILFIFCLFRVKMFLHCSLG